MYIVIIKHKEYQVTNLQTQWVKLPLIHIILSIEIFTRCVNVHFLRFEPK